MTIAVDSPVPWVFPTLEVEGLGLFSFCTGQQGTDSGSKTGRIHARDARVSMFSIIKQELGMGTWCSGESPSRDVPTHVAVPGLMTQLHFQPSFLLKHTWGGQQVASQVRWVSAPRVEDPAGVLGSWLPPGPALAVAGV